MLLLPANNDEDPTPIIDFGEESDTASEDEVEERKRDSGT